MNQGLTFRRFSGSDSGLATHLDELARLRIAVFREAGDSKGVERFSILAACLDQLQFGPARGQ